MNGSQLAITGELSELLAKPSQDDAIALLGLPPGLHPNVSESVYHTPILGMASKSALDEVARSPAHYRAWLAGTAVRSTPALRFGKACHRAILEPEAFAREYVIAPDFGDCRKKENKERRDAFRREYASSTILENAEGVATLGMIRAVCQHPIARALFEDGASECTLRWQDSETGIESKARTDHYREELEVCVDVKSTTNAGADAFRRDVWNYGYHRQDAWYRLGFARIGKPIRHFVFVVVEKTPPHAVAVYQLDGDAVGLGRTQNERLIGTMAKCLESDTWPGYDERIQEISLPAWANRRD